ncbi:MAG: metallophosphoesterase [Clostridiales bacterium]|nr:metallophosphoesterase [Clostridiales bacterium]
MKKIFSILLAVLLICSSVPMRAFAAQDEPVSFAVASDIHYNLPRTELEGEIDDPIYWYANRRAAMEDESGFILDAFLEQCASDEGIEFVLIAGDLADNGRSIIEEHLDVAEKLCRFEQNTGKQVYVINGNHDLGTNSACDVESFKEIYHEFGYDEALTTVEGTCSYTADLNAKYRLIALDSCDPDVSTEDGMDKARVDWVCAQARQAVAEGKYPILMMHHNLLDHMPAQRIVSHNFIIRNHLSTAARFADAGIRLCVSGHEHCSDGAKFVSPTGSLIYDFAVTSLTMYPLQYRLFTLREDEIEYAAKTVDSIDIDALTAAVDGYTPEMLEKMSAGMNDYAKGFLKAGVQYRLTRSLRAEQMGLPEEGLLMRIIGRVPALADTPYKGDNGLNALGKSYGIELPETEYETPWDLVGEIVAMHYAGGEDLTMDSPEVRLLLRTLVLILRHTLCADLPRAYAPHGIAAVSYFVLAAAAPFIVEFACDTDGVDDNNGILPGYAVQDRTGNLSAAVTEFYNELKNCVSLISTYFLMGMRA